MEIQSISTNDLDQPDQDGDTGFFDELAPNWLRENCLYDRYHHLSNRGIPNKYFALIILRGHFYGVSDDDQDSSLAKAVQS